MKLTSRLPSFLLIVILTSIATASVFAQDRLIFAIDIIRHGDRTPIEEIPASPHKWIEGLGQLTPTGMSQEYQLGKALRDKYVNQYHLLPPHYSSETMYVRSTAINRTLVSAQSFLAGLYPLGTGPNLPNTRTPALPGAYQPIPIFSLPEEQDILLRPDHGENEIYQLLKKHVFSTPEWIAKNAELKPKYVAWSKATGMNITTISDLGRLSDTLFIRQLYNIPLPEGLSQHDAQQIINAGQWMPGAMYKNPSISTLAGIDVLNMIAQKLLLASKQNTPLKYILFSAHDSTIEPQMAILGSPLDKRTEYASNLNFSLFDKGDQHYYIKIAYNNQPVFIKPCGQTDCTLEQFLQFVEQEKVSAKNLRSLP